MAIELGRHARYQGTINQQCPVKDASSKAAMTKPYFMHPLGVVDEGAIIGAGTKVWAFAHVVKGAVIGEDCNLCDHTFIEGNVKIGHRVTLKCGVYLWDGVTVEDDVFIGPGALFTNDPRPRSKKYPVEYARTVLRQGCSIGAGAIILPGITIGCWAMIAAGAVVTRTVPDHALVVGNPAKPAGWVCRCGQKLVFVEGETATCRCGRTYRLRSDQTIKEEPHEIK